MKITAISAQKRRPDRYSIYIDRRYEVSLAEAQLVAAGLRTGDEISESELNALRSQSELGKGLDKAYHFLSYRSRSVREVAQFLRRKKYDDEQIDQIIRLLKTQDLINDERFAAEWVSNRQLLSPRSKTQLRAELRQKGLAPEAIDMALESIDESSEIETIRALVRTKRLRYRYDDERKLIVYLASKGFSYGAIKTALEE